MAAASQAVTNWKNLGRNEKFHSRRTFLSIWLFRDPRSIQWFTPSRVNGVLHCRDCIS
jgi:hypothetical protein